MTEASPAVASGKSFTAADQSEAGVLRRLVRAPSALVGLAMFVTVVVLALGAPLFAGDNSYSPTNPLLSAPSWDHPMGTDNFQRDLLNLVIHGIRISMTVVASVVLISATIGIILGLLAGYLGGVVDDVITRTAELFQSVPRFFLALTIIELYGPGLNKIILVLGLTSWTLLARVVRAETLSIRSRPFVEASRAVGAPRRSVLVRHVLPNVLPQAAVIIVLMGSRVILIEAGLAFLGLGDPLSPSLGVLARNAQDLLRQSWWTAVYPGIAIVVAVMGMNLLSDGLAQALNPRAESRGRWARRTGAA